MSETLAEVTDAAERLVWEHERAEVLGTTPPSLDELRDLASDIQALDDPDEPECSCFDGLRWPKMIQAERLDILTRLQAWARTTEDNPRMLAIEAVVEALQRVCETAGVL